MLDSLNKIVYTKQAMTTYNFIMNHVSQPADQAGLWVYTDFFSRSVFV